MPGTMAVVEWGPVGVWAGATGSVLAVTVAVLVAVGAFDRFRAPKVALSFEHTEPWCRAGQVAGSAVVWVRIGVANVGTRPAVGCVGRMTHMTTDGRARRDVDPVQLRWAGLPRSRAFDPVDLRHGQREYLDVVLLREGQPCRILTFEDPDFDPGFSTEMDLGAEHVLDVAVFVDNAATVAGRLAVRVGDTGTDADLRLL